MSRADAHLHLCSEDDLRVIYDAGRCDALDYVLTYDRIDDGSFDEALFQEAVARIREPEPYAGGVAVEAHDTGAAVNAAGSRPSPVAPETA